MYQLSFHTKKVIFTIFNHLKHIQSKVYLVAQWVHPLGGEWVCVCVVWGGVEEEGSFL